MEQRENQAEEHVRSRGASQPAVPKGFCRGPGALPRGQKWVPSRWGQKQSNFIRKSVMNPRGFGRGPGARPRGPKCAPSRRGQKRSKFIRKFVMNPKGFCRGPGARPRGPKWAPSRRGQKRSNFIRRFVMNPKGFGRVPGARPGPSRSMRGCRWGRSCVVSLCCPVPRIGHTN